MFDWGRTRRILDPHLAHAACSQQRRSNKDLSAMRKTLRLSNRAHRTLSALLGLFTLLLLGGSAPAQDAANSNAATPNAAAPNIVFIIADDMDYEHFGFMGSQTAKTPAIDRLAETGFTFTTAHLPMSRCHPTLASFLSGRYPHQTGIYYNYGTAKLDPANSLPNLLKDAGYATFVTGKYWEGDPRAMGFTHGEGKDTTLVRQGQDSVNAFLDEVGGKQPFLLWWAPLLPHTPHNPSEERLARFPKNEIPFPVWFTGRKQQYRNREQKSLAMETWLDDGVDNLMQELDKRGLRENTLIVFLVDNGWCNGLVSKGSPFEKGLRTPVIFNWPGHVSKGRSEELISTLDTFSTMLEFASVTPPDGLPGQTLSPVVRSDMDADYAYRQELHGAIYPAFATEGDQRPERDVYALYVRTKDWKYVLYVQDVVQERNGNYFRIQSILTDYPARSAGDEDLYRLTDDPYELNNLAADPAQAERLQKFRASVLKWWEETGGKPLPELRQ